MLNGKQSFIYGDGEQIRDFVFVEDVARANLLAIESEINGIFNICTNTQVAINLLLETMNDVLGKNISPIFTNEREGDIKNSYMTYEKVKQSLGWEPKILLKEGLKRTISFYETKLD